MKGLITQETAVRIWTCYREIKAAKELLEKLDKDLKEGNDPSPIDAFGRRSSYQFGVPSGDNSHRLYDVPPRLALSVIRAHIAEKERELVEANEQARIELEIGK